MKMIILIPMMLMLSGCSFFYPIDASPVAYHYVCPKTGVHEDACGPKGVMPNWERRSELKNVCRDGHKICHSESRFGPPPLKRGSDIGPPIWTKTNIGGK